MTNRKINFITRMKKQLLDLYLSFFNLVLATGWNYIFWSIIIGTLTNGRSYFFESFTKFRDMALFLQLFDLLDIANAYFGLWGESKVPLYWRLYCKIGRRLLLTPIFWIYPIHSHPICGLMLFTWSMTDYIRYPFYFCSIWSIKPKILVILRYSDFLIQFPLNVISEVTVHLLMMPYIFKYTYHNIILLILACGYLFTLGMSQCYGVYNFKSNYIVLFKILIEKIHTK